MEHFYIGDTIMEHFYIGDTMMEHFYIGDTMMDWVLVTNPGVDSRRLIYSNIHHCL